MTAERDPEHDLAGNEVWMEAEAAACFLAALDRADIRVWVDGGWGVDALLRVQTRRHRDLDLVVDLADAGRALDLLTARGFELVYDARPTRFVLCDRQRHRLDFHTVGFDEQGAGVQIQEDGRAFRYPAAGFRGEGEIGGRRVRCLEAETQVLCHLGYEPDADDRHDMLRLHERFGVALPPPYTEG